MNYFVYKGEEIRTKFKLSEEQEEALKTLIDYLFDKNNEEPITLSGYGGTGKTSIIKYVEKFMNQYFNYDNSRGFNFIYAAPTHAATVYLGLNLGYLPFTVQSILVNKFVKNTFVKTFSSKFMTALDYEKKNVLIIDESSMLATKDVEELCDLCKKHNIKVIFLGDKAQIPEISNNDKKYISKVFTDFKNVQLTKVHRTSSDSILRVLTEIRNNPTGYLPITKNTNEIFYYDITDNTLFFNNFINKYSKEPDQTVFISYTNKIVKSFNKRVREKLFGEDSNGLVIGESIIGYGGYNNKQILNNNLANSVKYQVKSITLSDNTPSKGIVFITGFSEVLNKINKKYGEMLTRYYQLSLEDSIVMKEITEEDMKTNNERISSIFRVIYYEKEKALKTNKWISFFKKLEGQKKFLSSIELGNNYIYNPDKDCMELYNAKEHNKLKKEHPELYMEKGIDYGYAMTIHKSQGSTYNNIFFNALSTESNDNPLMENNVQVGTEGNSLNYVGMSRAAKELHVLYGNKIKIID